MSETIRTARSEKASAAADASFSRIANTFAKDPRVTAGTAFASPGLKVDGKIFAMLVKGRLVVKLPRERVDELVRSGRGRNFETGRGSPMKEWVVLTGRTPSWLACAREAHAFVAADTSSPT